MSMRLLLAFTALTGTVLASPVAQPDNVERQSPSLTIPGLCPSPNTVVNQTTCVGSRYVYSELAGFGFTPSNNRDKFGDTLGGFGSSVAFDPLSWVRLGDVYTGILYALPDRGWNTNGTLNYQNRIHKFLVTLRLNCSATVTNPSPPNINLRYLDTVLITTPIGPTTGLDANPSGPYLSLFNTDVPSATYPGDGFNGMGPGGNRTSVDAEGLVRNIDGSFWVSDEYGPYIYNVSPQGLVRGVIRPPNAFIPQRNGNESFASVNPPIYDPARVITPANPQTGRANNQGFEGLTASPDGSRLYALTQSALNQEGGSTNTGRRNSRLVVYDTSTPSNPRLIAEYVVPLPTYVNNNGNTRIAAQSEIKYVSPTQFLILSRDSNSGRGAQFTNSVYRHADVFDISSATNIVGQYDNFTDSIASSSGVLKPGIVAATYCPFLDFNVNSQLNRFGVRNGGAQADGLLNEKWESFALVPVNPLNPFSTEFFLFSVGDNDFITQDGYLNGGKFRYADGSGFNVENQVLAFRVTLPTARPRTG